jgi:hypothetical protein
MRLIKAYKRLCRSLATRLLDMQPPYLRLSRKPPTGAKMIPDHLASTLMSALRSAFSAPGSRAFRAATPSLTAASAHAIDQLGRDAFGVFGWAKLSSISLSVKPSLVSSVRVCADQTAISSSLKPAACSA